MINTNPRHENFDSKVDALAQEYGLYVTAGSDAHRTEDATGAAILSHSEIKHMEDFISLIRSGKYELYRSENQ